MLNTNEEIFIVGVTFKNFTRYIKINLLQNYLHINHFKEKI